jgi:hypothetical protein
LDAQTNPNVSQDHIESLLNFYAAIVGAPDPSTIYTGIEIAYKDELAQIIDERFGPVFEILDRTAQGKDVLTSEEFAGAMDESRLWLAGNHSPEWLNWKITPKKGGYATYQETKEFIAGQNPAGVARLRAVTLLGHEMLGHGLVSVRAQQYGDPHLQIGLPGFEKFGEAWATKLGWVASGTSSAGAIDFYTDIALALGSINGRPYSREELLPMSHARAIVTEQLETGNLVLDPNTYQRVTLKGNQAINRITRTGLLTKDVIYYAGYDRLDTLISQHRANGVSMERIFGYFTLGGFDPDIDVHREHVQKWTGRPGF